MKLNFKSKEDIAKFIADELINTKEAMVLLGCSRQNIFDLVKRGKLVPVKEMPKDRLFFKEDILDRKVKKETE